MPITRPISIGSKITITEYDCGCKFYSASSVYKFCTQHRPLVETMLQSPEETMQYVILKFAESTPENSGEQHIVTERLIQLQQEFPAIFDFVNYTEGEENDGNPVIYPEV